MTESVTFKVNALGAFGRLVSWALRSRPYAQTIADTYRSTLTRAIHLRGPVDGPQNGTLQWEKYPHTNSITLKSETGDFQLNFTLNERSPDGYGPYITVYAFERGSDGHIKGDMVLGFIELVDALKFADAIYAAYQPPPVEPVYLRDAPPITDDDGEPLTLDTFEAGNMVGFERGYAAGFKDGRAV